jgi:hypothetical protein
LFAALSGLFAEIFRHLFAQLSPTRIETRLTDNQEAELHHKTPLLALVNQTIHSQARPPPAPLSTSISLNFMTRNFQTTRTRLNRIEGKFQSEMAKDGQIYFLRTPSSKPATVLCETAVNEQIVPYSDKNDGTGQIDNLSKLKI